MRFGEATQGGDMGEGNYTIQVQEEDSTSQDFLSSKIPMWKVFA